MLAASFLLAWIAYKRGQAAEQQAAYRMIIAKGGATNFGPESARPHWLRWILGDDVAAQGACAELSACKLTDAEVRQLTALRNLSRLSLDRTPVTDQGVAFLPRFRHLKYLSLSETNISDASLESLRACRELEWLMVDRTRTTDAGIQKLRAALPGLTIVDANDKEWQALNQPAQTK